MHLLSHSVWEWLSCVLCKAAIQVWAGLHFCLEFGVLFQGHVTIGRLWTFEAVGLKCLFSGWLTPEAAFISPSFLAMWSFHTASHNLVASFLKVIKRISCSSQLTSLMEHNLIKDVTSLYLCHTLLSRRKVTGPVWIQE